MGMIQFLLALHPKRWRESYGEEFVALLEQTQMTPAAVADVVRHAAGLHARQRSGTLLVVTAALVSEAFEKMALAGKLTANILWAPTTPARALALAGLLTPWALLAGRAAGSRRARRATGA